MSIAPISQSVPSTIPDVDSPIRPKRKALNSTMRADLVAQENFIANKENNAPDNNNNRQKVISRVKSKTPLEPPTQIEIRLAFKEVTFPVLPSLSLQHQIPLRLWRLQWMYPLQNKKRS